MRIMFIGTTHPPHLLYNGHATWSFFFTSGGVLQGFVFRLGHLQCSSSQPICQGNANPKSVHILVIIDKAFSISREILDITLPVRVMPKRKTPT